MPGSGSAPSESPPKVADWNLHPIRLQFAHLSKLVFEAKEVPANLNETEKAKATPGFVRFGVKSNVGEGQALVVSTVTCLFKDDHEQEAAEGLSGADYYNLEVSVTSGFVFKPEEMTKEEVQEWCQKGSVFVVLPFIRGLVATVTRESGFPPFLLPLLEVPTFRPPTVKPAAKPASPPQG
jgi:preprotein translocase subunit SecB